MRIPGKACTLGPQCRKPVAFVQLPTGRRMPIDPDPDPEGTVAVYRDAAGTWVGRVLKHDEQPDAWETLHTTHFATCAAKKARDAHAAATKRARAAPNVTVMADFASRKPMTPRAHRGRAR